MILSLCATLAAGQGVRAGSSGFVPLPKDFVPRATAYLEERARLGRFTGAVRIDVDGRTVLRRAWGYADWTLRKPFTPQTPGYLFSLTKSFTAGAVLLLAERGKLGLDDAVGKWLPDLPEAWRAPTLRQLLTHTSGISGRDGAAWLTKRYGPSDAASALASSVAATKPGERYAYSNLGYVLLGEVVSAASGRPYVRFVQEELLRPLGLRSAGSGGHFEGQAQVARGHTVFGGGLVPCDQTLTGIVGAGDLHASVDDMVRWRAAIDGPGLFSEATRKTLHEAPVATGEGTRYGYGWTFDDQWPMWEHSGGGSGSSSDLIRLPDRGTTIAVLKNSDGSAGRNPAMDLARLAYGREPAAGKALGLDALDRTQGVYRDAAGREATVYLIEDVPVVIRPGKLEQAMEYAGGLKFQSSGTVAAFVPRSDGLFDLRLRLNGREDMTLTRVTPLSGLDGYVGTYGTGLWAFRIEHRGRWLAERVRTGDGANEALDLALIPSAKGRFVVPRLGLEMRFARDAGGRVSAVETWRGGKRVLTSKRV